MTQVKREREIAIKDKRDLLLCRCGRLCCDEHTQYEIRLNTRAQHDPEHGVWSKVCVECFINRPGYMDHQGVTNSKTGIFLKLREKTIDRVHLESNRLEKRLEKLARIHHATDLQKRPPAITSSSSASLLQPPSLLSHSSSTISLERSDSTSSRDSLGSMLSAKSSFVSNSNSILSMKLKYRGKEERFSFCVCLLICLSIRWRTICD